VEPVEGLERSVKVDGRTRRYILDVPGGGAGERLPVVFVFHGLGGNASTMRDWSRMGEQAHERGFIAVHPRGKMVHLKGMVGRGWQIAVDDDREVRLVEAILDQLDREYCIDHGRIYAAGFSNGGFLAHFLACSLPGRFAAIGAVSGGLDGIGEYCGAASPTPAVIINGDADPLVPVASGLESRALWVEKNSCEGEVAEGELCARSSECASGAEVLYCEVPGAGHTWFERPLDATSVILDFFLGAGAAG